MTRLPLLALTLAATGAAHAGGFVEFDGGMQFRDDRVKALSGRTDVAGDFGDPLAGLDLAFGVRGGETDLGAHRFGLSFGYYGNRFPSWLAELGADFAIATTTKDHRNARRDQVPDYRFRTEEYAIPMSLFYEYEWSLFRGRVRLRTGVSAGMTAHVLRTNFSGKLDSDHGISPHCGLRAGLVFPINSGATHLRLGYEYRREAGDTYDPGVRLAYSDRDSHGVTVALVGRF